MSPARRATLGRRGDGGTLRRVGECWAIVVGAGGGSRFGGPKQYESLGGERVIDRSRRIAGACCDGVVCVVPAEDVEGEGAVAGGATRSESVRAGLAAVPLTADVICVHDAARPLASPALYAAVIEAVRAGADGAVPGIPVSDTIKVIDNEREGGGVVGIVVATPDRSTLVAVQTPQAFAASALRGAHAASPEGTDDAVLVEAYLGADGRACRVVAVPGDPDNIKITVTEDLERARRLLGVAEVPT